MALVFNRASDNYLFTIAEARGKVGESLKLRSANSAAAIDISNTGTVDISGTFTVNGSSVASGDTVVLLAGTQEITGNKTFSGTTTINTLNINGGTITGITDLAIADGGTGASIASDARTNLGLVIGSDIQAYDTELAALAGLSSAANKGIQFTGSGTAATFDLTAAGKALLDDADAAAQRTTLGLGDIATQASNSVSITGGAIDGTTIGATTAAAATFSQINLYHSSGTSTITKDENKITIDPYPAGGDSSGTVVIEGNLIVNGNTTTINSTIVDISDSILTLNYGLTGAPSLDGGIVINRGSSASKSFLWDESQTTWTIGNETFNSRTLKTTNLNVTNLTANDGTAAGSIADSTGVVTLNNVDINAGTITGITDLAIADGGTGASNASDARTNLGLQIGSDIQAYDAELAAIAGLTSEADKGIQFTGSGAAATFDLTAAGKALLDDADAAAQRTTLGLGDIATQASNSVSITGGAIDGTTIGATTSTTGKFTTLELTGNLLPSNTTAQIPVTKSTFTLVNSNLGDLSGTNAQGGSTFVGSTGDADFQNATNYLASRIALSGDSLIKMEFKVNFVSSPEAEQTISFRVRRTIGGTTTIVFTDENIGSNMGVTFRNVYNGTFIDDLAASTVADNTNITYQLQYKRNCPNDDTISTNFGIVSGGNYIFLQELYCP